MKSIILIPALFLFFIQINAQLIEKEDGKYYDHNNNLYSGTYIEYFPSGRIQLEMNVLNGEKHGITTLYYDNNQKKEIRSFKNNKMDGTWITWGEKGEKTGEASYIDGVKHGKWGIWDKNGIQRYEMEYDHGKKAGVWIIRDEKGIIIDRKKF